MRVSVLTAASVAVLFLAPAAFAQTPAPPAEPMAPADPAPAPAGEPLVQPVMDPEPVEAEPAVEEKMVCRAVRDPRTRQTVRKCETVEARERRLKRFSGRQAKADTNGDDR